MSQPRFFIEHDMIHDRATGQHVTSEADTAYQPGRAALLALLNTLSAPTSQTVLPTPVYGRCLLPLAGDLASPWMEHWNNRESYPHWEPLYSESQVKALVAAAAPKGELQDAPSDLDLTEPVKAMFPCEDCDGEGEVGEPQYQGEFQPPERARCPTCRGSGNGGEHLAYHADEVNQVFAALRAAALQGAALTAEPPTEADALDAKRYRRIRNGPHSDNYGDLYGMTFQGDGDVPVTGAELDAACDAALRQAAGSSKEGSSK
jgi:hypothetical protein